MSFGNGYNGGRTRMSTKVLLHLYDLSPSNDLLYPLGLGLHHSGVEVFGQEYSFASVAGVFATATTREAPPGTKYRETIEMGPYEGNQIEFQRILDILKNTDYGPHDYHLIRRNCNHFANALVWNLTGNTIPSHINRLAQIGNCCSCLIPNHLLNNAPVGDPTATQSNAPSGYQMIGRGAATQNDPILFSGSGNRLGTNNNNNNNNNNNQSSNNTITQMLKAKRDQSPRQDDLVDRRERVRKAALARMEQQQQQQQQLD